MRFVVFGGWFGSGNLGDDAILIGLRRVLERVFPRVEIVTLSTDPAHTRRVCGVGAKRLMSARGLFRRGDDSLSAYLQAFMDADACVVSGGTPIYDYGHLSRGFHFGLPKITKTSLICFGVGVKSIESMMGASSVRMLLQGARLVSTRDALSRDELVRLGVGGRISVTGDSGLFLEPAEREDALRLLTESGVDTSRPMTAICPRFLSTQHRRHYHDPLSSVEVSRIRRGVAGVADHLLHMGFEVVFLPFHRGSVDDDLAEIRAIVSLMHRSDPKIVKRDLLPGETMSVLGCMKLVFGLRLHSLIFAASLGIPVVGVNYDSKIRGFMDLAGARECLCEVYGEPRSWVEVVDTVLDDGGVMGRVISRSCGGMRARVLDEAGRMRDLLKAGY
ncbi:polysaccharide pyruvyl transferase family protein [Candidatus Bathyarchaeota archaeon]|nr:polysaccharide pyruvyl transferase family protein [Candidatus Bathyarchaeota archaeon]MBL7167162.1 polysaccharide pyruvyl transferase family protein [Candidatus Bathyarchaeota archaeon]